MGTRDCEGSEGGERGRGAKERMGNHLLRGPSYLFELGPTSISCLVRICGSVRGPQAISRTTVMHCTLDYRPEGNPLCEMNQILKVHVNGDGRVLGGRARNQISTGNHLRTRKQEMRLQRTSIR
jgi:hypothetical protein